MQEIKNGSGDITIKLWGSVYNTNLLEAYNAAGSEFVKYIDGDFSLVLEDKGENIMIVAVDAFASKPLWILSHKDKGGLVGVVDCPPPGCGQKVPPNYAYVYDLDNGGLRQGINVYDWDLTQNVKTYDKWIEAFEAAIAKRTKDVADQLFIGLSSGYDSGAIACELQKQNVPFDAYTLRANEAEYILTARHKLLNNSTIKYFTIDEYNSYRDNVIKCGVDYKCRINHWGKSSSDHLGQTEYNYKFDKASAGDAWVCDKGRRNNKSIALSGHGSDEIISDYGWNNRQHYSQSQLGGLFPDDLSSVFPYGNFYKGTMDAYIAKTEFIGRLYGVEARYPYLDIDLVQEFLHLTPKLKNVAYKAPLHEYFTRNKYPYDVNVKNGFNANHNCNGGISGDR